MTSVQPRLLHGGAGPFLPLHAWTARWRVHPSAGSRRRRRQPWLVLKYSKLNRAMAELVEDFSLVNFVTCVEDKESMAGVLRLIDKANGYCFGDLPLHPGAYHMTASQAARR